MPVDQTFILALETSSRNGALLLARGPQILAQSDFPVGFDHAAEMFPFLDKTCREHHVAPPQIALCFISIGPGSFTGLRLAVAFARHLALAVNARICAVPSMDVIARNCLNPAPPCPHLAVILPARADQVFGAIYELTPTSANRTTGPIMCPPAMLLSQAPRPLSVIGEAAANHHATIRDSGATLLDESLWHPKAANVHAIGWEMSQRGEFTPPQELIPLYIRRPEAEEVWDKKHAPPDSPQKT